MAFDLTLNTIISPINENGFTTLSGVISGLDVQGGEVTLDIDWGDPLSPPQNQQFTLKDDGTGDDLVAGDGQIEFSFPKQYLDDNPSGTSSDIYNIKVDATENFLVGTDLSLVIDVSGSTDNPVGGIDVGDQNGDGTPNTILDAEIAGTKSLVQSLIDKGLGNEADVSVAIYADSSALIDLDPNTAGVQTVAKAGADLNGNGKFDVLEALETLYSTFGGNGGQSSINGFTGVSVGNATNFEAGLDAAILGVQTAGTAPGDGTVIFLSDGGRNRGDNGSDEADYIRDVLGQELKAFGVGSGSSLPDLQAIDPEAQKFTDIQDLLDLFNGVGEFTNTDSDSIDIQVNNVAPSVSINLSSASINEDGSVTVTGNFSDPGTLDTHTATINWGDGTGNQALTLNADGSFSATYQYLDDGSFGGTPQNGTPSDNYTITVAVTDDDTGVGTATAVLTVNDVAPVLGPLSDNLPGLGIIVEGDPLNLSANYTDVGTKDFHTVEFNWGDGSPVDSSVENPLGGGTGTASGSHVYTTAGSYTATLTVTDDDTLFDSDSVDVIVAKKVDLDWKPGSNPSAMNFTGKGIIPVAVLGADDFDVMDIDVASIKFDDQKDELLNGGGVGINVKNNGTYQFSYEDTNFDGYVDLVAHVSKVELGSVVNPDQEPFLSDGQIYAFGAFDNSYFFGCQQAGDPIKVTG